jgi:hypothetical protein
MARKLLNSKQLGNYEKTIDDYLYTVGRVIEVYVGSGIPTDNWDIVNQEPLDPNVPVTYDWTIHKIENVSIRWLVPEDYVLTAGGRLDLGEVEIKCRLQDVLVSGSDPNGETIFNTASKVIIDGEECKERGKPQKMGLQELNLVKVFLDRVHTG